MKTYRIKLISCSLLLGILGVSLFSQIPPIGKVAKYTLNGNSNNILGNNTGITSRAVYTYDRLGDIVMAYESNKNRYIQHGVIVNNQFQLTIGNKMKYFPVTHYKWSYLAIVTDMGSTSIHVHGTKIDHSLIDTNLCSEDSTDSWRMQEFLCFMLLRG